MLWIKQITVFINKFSAQASAYAFFNTLPKSSAVYKIPPSAFFYLKVLLHMGAEEWPLTEKFLHLLRNDLYSRSREVILPLNPSKAASGVLYPILGSSGQKTWSSWTKTSGGQQRRWSDWSISLMRKCWGSWACSALRRDSERELNNVYQSLKGGCQEDELGSA